MKRRYCIQVQIVSINDFREETIKRTFIRYTYADSLNQAINNVKFNLRKEGYKIGKDNDYDDYNLNIKTEYRFSEVVKKTEENKEEIYYPEYDELEDYVREEDLQNAQKLYEWDENGYHLPDSNKDTLLMYMNSYNNACDEMEELCY